MPFHCCHVFIVRLVLLYTILQLGNAGLQAQIPGTELFQQKINYYNASHPKQVLFVQTDKTLYTNNETIWFAGYLLQDINDSLLKADILAVSLLEESSQKIVLQKKYAFANNLCPGSLLLPDSIQPGNYQLLAFANLVNKKGEPLAVYKQRLTIKSINDFAFSTNFTMDTLFTSDTLRINVKVELPGVGTGLASFASIDYHLREEKPRTLRLDVYGRGNILMPRTKIKQQGQFLFTTTRYKKEAQYFNLQLPSPVRQDSLNVLFYPEGGDLVDGLKSRVAWEVKTTFGTSVQTAALLMKDGKITDTLTSNYNGTGIFSIVPEKDKHYVLRLLPAYDKSVRQDFPLPVSLHKGVVLEIKNAIATDTLNMTIKSSNSYRVSIAVSNANEGTVSLPIEINRERNIQLPLNKISKGINTITIVDEKGRALAERLFFAHFDKKSVVDLQTDKSSYSVREKVDLGIQLTDTGKAGIGGLFTIACVQNSRVEPGNRTDIESYYYLDRLFDEMPVFTSGRGFENKQFMEDVLLLKGWRRYTWQRLIANDDQDTSGVVNKLTLTGQVFRNNKILKKPVDLVMMRDSVIETFATNAKGTFMMNPFDIAVTENRKMFLKVAGDNTFGYNIVNADTLGKTMLKEAERSPFHKSGKPSQLQTNITHIITDQPKLKTLKEVFVTAGRTQDENGYYNKKTNACGDYICINHVLNCRNHTDAYELPVKGKFYHSNINFQASIMYAGCIIETEPAMAELSNVFTAREFYGMDSILLQQANPEYMSTIYWKPFVLTDEKGQSNISFYTSDTKGDFRITVQGIGNNGEPFYSEKRIRVE